MGSKLCQFRWQLKFLIWMQEGLKTRSIMSPNLFDMKNRICRSSWGPRPLWDLTVIWFKCNWRIVRGLWENIRAKFPFLFSLGLCDVTENNWSFWLLAHQALVVVCVLVVPYKEFCLGWTKTKAIDSSIKDAWIFE